MSYDPIEPSGSVDRVEPAAPIEPSWAATAIDPVGGIGPLEPIAAPEGPQSPQAPQRDARAEALNIAQHATVFIPAPLPFTRVPDAERRRR